jgi:hypothetical protein
MKKIIIIILLLTAGYKEICYAAPKYTVDASQKDKWTNGLVGYWTFDGPDMDWSQSSAEARDVSGQGNHGDVTNFGKEAVRAGKVGQALEFDGVDDYVNTSGDFIGANTVTVCAWIKPRSITDDDIVGNEYFRFTIFGSGQNQIFVSSNGGGSSAGTAPGVIVLNTWQYLCGVRLAGTNGLATLYVNGQQSGSANQNSGTPQESWTSVTIGRKGGESSSNYVNGLIDEVRIYSRALSPEEVEELYNMGQRKYKP